MRFSDKVHFGYGLQGKLCIIYKLGKQYCPDYIQENKKLNKKNKKCYHYWAIMGYNFKLDINFYKISRNSNRKISQKVYINQIFQLIVKFSIDAHHDFVLEKDGNSSH